MRKAEAMTKQEWEQMTGQQKYDSILAGTWSVQSRMGIDANSKVGDSGAAFRAYATFSDDIQISGWKETKLKAAEEAVSNVKELIA
jgi:hypothetical protein